MENYSEEDNKEKRDFNILFYSILLFSCIMIFIMNRFWRLEYTSIAGLMMVLLLISFIPAATNVRHFKKIVILFMSAGVLCGAAALFILLQRHMYII